MAIYYNKSDNFYKFKEFQYEVENKLVEKLAHLRKIMVDIFFQENSVNFISQMVLKINVP